MNIHSRSTWLFLGVAGAGLIGMFSAAPAAAQSVPADSVNEAAPQASDEPSEGEILVTAQRYSERLQDVPISISAITGDQLAERGITDLKALSGTVPSLFISGSAGLNGSNIISIRGLSGQPLAIGASQATAIYLDGVYLPRPDAAFFALDDLERVEVLRGPQGTLYGRNATAGAINIITKTPGDRIEGGIDASFGNYDAIQAKGSLLFPIGGGFSGGVSGSYSRHDGYFVNSATGNRVEGNEAYTVRGKLRFEGADRRFSGLLSADISRNDGSIFFENIVDTGIGDPFVIPSDALSEARSRVLVKSSGIGLTLSLQASDAVELTYVGGYRHFTNSSAYDVDGSAAGTFFPPFGPPPARFNIFSVSRNESKAYTNEFRVHYGSDALRATVGANAYINEQSFGSAPSLPTVIVQPNNPIAKDKLLALAAFGQVEWTLADRLTLVGGLRFNREERNFSVDYSKANPALPNLSGRQSDNAVLPAAGINFQMTPDVLLYAKFGQGYQSPGFNGSTPATALAPNTFNAEHMDAYEVGIKSQFLDRRLTFNAAAFHYDYSDIQVRSTITVGQVSIFNAAAGKIGGIEASLSARLIDGLTLSGNLTYLDARYTSFCEAALTGNPANGSPVCTTGTAGPNDGFDRAGKRLNQAPKWQGGANLDFDQEIDGFGRLHALVSYSASSTVYYTTANELLASSGKVSRLDARLGLTIGEGPELYLFGRNLTNSSYVDLALRANAFLAPVHVSEPRTYGVGLRYKF